MINYTTRPIINYNPNSPILSIGGTSTLLKPTPTSINHTTVHGTLPNCRNVFAYYTVLLPFEIPELPLYRSNATLSFFFHWSNFHKPSHTTHTFPFNHQFTTHTYQFIHPEDGGNMFFRRVIRKGPA